MGDSYSQENASYLLKQLEYILECDSLIDEVGFVHPSQIEALNDETAAQHSVAAVPEPVNKLLKTSLLDVNALQYNNNIFWSGDHKLAISAQMLLPLYNAARHAFMTALEQHKIHIELTRKTKGRAEDITIGRVSSSKEFLESELMKHSKAVLLLSCDFGTAWNSRKLVISQKQKFSVFMEELLLSSLILSYSPKSEHAWSHRRWVIKRMEEQKLHEIVARESELVEKIAEKSKMNYRAWNHRCWLVTHMTREQVLDELSKTRKWAELHAADNCCFHYRRRLLHRILESSGSQQGSNVNLFCMPRFYHIWKEELDWDEMLIKRYVGREALWVHRRFLSQFGARHFANNAEGAACHSGDQDSTKPGSIIFINNELLSLRSCLDVLDNDFEDGQAQAVLAVSYILWLSKLIPLSGPMELQQKLWDLDVKTLLNKFCPEKTLLWDGLLD